MSYVYVNESIANKLNSLYLCWVELDLSNIKYWLPS